MRFGSVCSGIEAASVAWHPLGWKAAWLSEIEPFPSAILKHHYPDVPNLGDMTTLPERILSEEIEAPDIFCGGTPCQAFSVAGLRKSLEDARGNLSLTFCEIANAIDYVRSVRSTPPAIVFWENVPGVLSTADNAFGCFLGALAGEDEPIVPSGGKWTNAGCVYGPQRAVAWRVLDAQYFGVAQRRRRVFVVASAREGFDPAAVLFEFDGVRRDTAPSREAGQRVAACLGACPAASSQPNVGNGQGNVVEVLAVDAYNQEDTGPVSKTVASRHDQDTASCVVQTSYAIQGSMIGRNDNAGPQGDGINEEVCFTQNCVDRHAVAFGVGESPDTAHCLRSGASKADKHESTTYVAQPMAFDGYNQTLSDTCQTIRADKSDGDHVGMVMQSIGWSEELTASVELAGTIQRGGEGGRHDGVMTSAMQVRRLTLVECERLQGFPDNYTNIPWRNKPEAPDGPRYKALGNSWAVPVVTWIGRRIQKELS